MIANVTIITATRARDMISRPRWESIYQEVSMEAKPNLRVNQIRVLRALAQADGPLSRQGIAEAIGASTSGMIGRAIGYSDPIKRAQFEVDPKGGAPFPSLLTLGLVREEELYGDVAETVVSITPRGLQAVEELADTILPPIQSRTKD